jgi:hypothetical protein
MSRRDKRKPPSDDEEEDYRREAQAAAFTTMSDNSGPFPPAFSADSGIDWSTGALPQNITGFDAVPATLSSDEEAPPRIPVRPSRRRDPSEYDVGKSSVIDYGIEASPVRDSDRRSIASSLKEKERVRGKLQFKRDARDWDQKSEISRISAQAEELGLVEAELDEEANRKAQEVYLDMCSKHCPILMESRMAVKRRNGPVQPIEYTSEDLANKSKGEIMAANGRLEKEVKAARERVNRLEREVARLREPVRQEGRGSGRVRDGRQKKSSWGSRGEEDWDDR